MHRASTFELNYRLGCVYLLCDYVLRQHPVQLFDDLLDN